MRSLVRALCAIGASFVCASGQAFTVGTGAALTSLYGDIDTAGPYASLYTASSSSPIFFGNLATYNPASNLLSIPGNPGQDFMRVVPVPLSLGGEADYFQGTYSLYMNLTPEGESSGGLFSIFGAIPSLGIDDPTLLLAATAQGMDVQFFPDPNQSPDIGILLQTVYVNPSFGDWTPDLLLAGNLSSTELPLHAPTTDLDALLGQQWVGGPGDYWDLYSIHSVPEPSTLGLMGLGLAAVGFAQRKRLALSKVRR